jgi:hypothetical protein
MREKLNQYSIPARLPEDANKPGGSSEVIPNINGFHCFMGMTRNCAMSMMMNAIYIQKNLPTIEVEERHQERIKVVCEELISTKHDVFHELMDLGEALTDGSDEAKCRMIAERMMLRLQEPIATLHNAVLLLKDDPQVSLAFTLVAESGVNIMNGYGDVDDAYKALKSPPKNPSPGEAGANKRQL